jgi:hypothetical protein
MTNETIFQIAEKHGDWDNFGRWTFRDSDKLLQFAEELLSLETKPETSTVSEKRKWVGLTKMELIKLGVFPFGMSYELYEAIEAKLKDKNT